MATIPVTLTTKPSGTQFDRVQLRSWQNLTTDDVGEPVALCNHADRSVKVGGNFGGATVYIEGFIGDAATELSNSDNWLPLTDPSDNFLELTTAKIEAISQVVMYVRPRIVGGTAPSITVYLLAKE